MLYEIWVHENCEPVNDPTSIKLGQERAKTEPKPVTVLKNPNFHCLVCHNKPRQNTELVAVAPNFISSDGRGYHIQINEAIHFYVAFKLEPRLVNKTYWELRDFLENQLHKLINYL